MLLFALEDDVAAREIVGRILAALPKDASVLAAIGDRYLERNLDAPQRNAGLAGSRIEQAAQQPDELVAREVFDFVGMDREHTSLLS